jgi:hypothetical protein
LKISEDFSDFITIGGLMGYYYRYVKLIKLIDISKFLRIYFWIFFDNRNYLFHSGIFRIA